MSKLDNNTFLDIVREAITQTKFTLEYDNKKRLQGILLPLKDFHKHGSDLLINLQTTIDPKKQLKIFRQHCHTFMVDLFNVHKKLIEERGRME